ncbi:hypothetical protein TYRP_023413 [Tyrophagus putrescentiae]|nr:hypothetical protein TYRP_023413 [Tyrophagus putrescentiae]
MRVDPWSDVNSIHLKDSHRVTWSESVPGQMWTRDLKMYEGGPVKSGLDDYLKDSHEMTLVERGVVMSDVDSMTILKIVIRVALVRCGLDDYLKDSHEGDLGQMWTR